MVSSSVSDNPCSVVYVPEPIGALSDGILLFASITPLTYVMTSSELACTYSKILNAKQYSILDYNPESSIKFRIYFHSKNLKSGRKNS